VKTFAKHFVFAKFFAKFFVFAKVFCKILVFAKICVFAKVFAKIFLSECGSGSRRHLNVYPDPNTGGCYLKFSRKPSRGQKFRRIKNFREIGNFHEMKFCSFFAKFHFTKFFVFAKLWQKRKFS
jgi:hypothetical protein